MKNLWFIALLFVVGSAGAETGDLPGGTCLKCHTDLEDDAAVLWKDDVHAKAGIGCEKCHGGDPTNDDQDAAMSKKAGFRGAPKRGEIPALCGSCHSDIVFMKKYSALLPVDQLEKYWTSVHGQRLKKGDVKVAQCATCHGAHGIRKVNDSQSPVYASNLPKMCSKCHSDAEYMKSYKIPTNQFEDYSQSVHGKLLLEKGDVRGAPACNDCHGNHGATPPGLHTVSNICGSCHAHNAELFLQSPMAKPFQTGTLAECVTCHGKHKILHTSDDWVGAHPTALCMQCHKPGDKGVEFAAYIAESISGLKNESKEVEALLEEARQKGMDVMEGADQIQAARQALIQARTELHAFSRPQVDAKFALGKESLEKAKALGHAALHENKTRRMGLAISSVFLTILVLALALKIRTLPKT